MNVCLVSEYTEVKLYGKNLKYYENLGYEIPKQYNIYGKLTTPKDTTITVKVDDLLKTSTAKVEICCDKCGKTRIIRYDIYNKHNHDGKTYCKGCAQMVLCSGEKSYNWNPNLTKEERDIGRHYPEYYEFVQRVLARDNYTCQCCGKKSCKDMAVHHLYGYSGYPEYRIDQSQAITLCGNCHDSFHLWHKQKFGRKETGNCTKEQFEEWIGKKDIILQTYDGEIPSARWAYCVTDNEIIKSIPKYSKAHNLDNSCIYECCNNKKIAYKGKIYVWYDVYKQMSDDEIQDYIISHSKSRDYSNMRGCANKRSKKVICITTGKIFDCISDAQKYYNIYGIQNCCNHKTKYSGKLPDGTCLVWAYFDEYTELSDDEKKNYQNKDYYSKDIIRKD